MKPISQMMILELLLVGVLTASVGASAPGQHANATSARRKYLASLEEKAHRMPVHEALTALRNRGSVTRQLLTFVEGQLLVEEQQKEVRHFRGSKQQAHLTATPAKPNLGAAETMLSGMIAESQLKLDQERERCVDFYKTQSQQIDETRQGIAQQQAKTAAGRAEKLRATAEINFIDQKVPKLTQALKDHNDECADDVASLEGQLAIVTQDLGVMELILNMSKCKSTETPSLMQFVRCCKHNSSMSMFMARTENTPLGQLKSSTARFLLDQDFKVRRMTFVTAKGVALEQQSGHDAASAADYIVLQDDERVNAEQNATTAAPTPVEEEKLCPEEAAGKCTISDSPACPRVLAKFLKIHAGIIEKQRDLQKELQLMRAQCASTAATMEKEISDMGTQRTEEETNMARATGEINQAEITLDAMQERGGRLHGQYVEQLEGCTVYENDDIHYEIVPNAGKCAETIHEYESEICGLKKIRMELLKMEGGEIYLSDVIDCEVSGWTEQECSKPCGGGTMTKTRVITVNPNTEGAECPPLEIEEVCNHEPCPVDCVVDEWTEWSACTASCGTGVKERQRGLKVHPAFGGLSCGDVSETESCNTQSCDRDCILGEWCEWTQCDKVCGGGSQKRVRFIAEPPQGEGVCYEEDSARRLQFQDCNTMACSEQMELNDTDPYISCSSKVDVMLVVDGSGSLKEDGWTATIAALKTFVNNMIGGEQSVELAILLFSGPRNPMDLGTCMGHAPAPPGWDELSDCKMTWVTHFTDDMAAVQEAIDKLTWPDGTTLTGKALQFAAAELDNGREDAEVVTIVITDGEPTDKMAVPEISSQLKSRGKLIWTLVGQDARANYDEVSPWASLPAHENLMEVYNTTLLPTPETINAIVAGFCTELSPSPPRP